MNKNLYIVYAQQFIDPVNNNYFIGSRKLTNQKLFFLNSDLLINNLNSIFSYLNWFLKKKGKIIFFVNPSDKILFSYFLFIINFIPSCTFFISSTGFEVNKFKYKQNCLIIALFVELNVLDFLKCESSRHNFPLISFSDVSLNLKEIPFFSISSLNNKSKLIILNLITLLILKMIKS